MVGAGVNPDTVNTQHDPGQGIFVPVLELGQGAFFFDELGVKVFAGSLIAQLRKHSKVVDAADLRDDFGAGAAEDGFELLQAHLFAVAEADDFDGGFFGQNRDQLRLRIRVVQEVGVRADGLHAAGDVEHGLEVPEGVEEAAGAAVLAVDLAEAALPGLVEVLGPVIVAVKLDGGNDKVGAFEDFIEVGGDLDGGVAARLIFQLFTETAAELQGLGIDVHQADRKFHGFQLVAVEDVRHSGGAERNTACADDCDFYFFHLLGLLTIHCCAADGQILHAEIK